MRHVAAELRSLSGRALARAAGLALLLGASSCGAVSTAGLSDAGAPGPSPDGGTSGVPPGSSGKVVAVWTCSGGGQAALEGSQLSVSVGQVSGATSLTAPGGARLTLGHFADTTAPDEE
jgi:hypothetical protein